MALSQHLWSIDDNMSLSEAELTSEHELEDILYQHIELLNPDWLVIGRQVKTKNGKILDLLCIDRDEDLVVVELKKDLTPREVTAQVIEYASYISELQIDEIGQIFNNFATTYLKSNISLDKAFYQKFDIDFDSEQITSKVKMIIVAAKMDDGTEHIINYLRNVYSVDINILFFHVFQHNDNRFLSRVWFEEDIEDVSTPVVKNNSWNGEFYITFGVHNGDGRRWEDAEKYGFISAGGGPRWTKKFDDLQKGDRVWVYVPKHGYVGVGIVTGSKMDAFDAVLNVGGKEQKMTSLDLKGKYFYSEGDTEKSEKIVPIRWIYTTDLKHAVKESGFFYNTKIVLRPVANRWTFTIDRLKTVWNIK